MRERTRVLVCGSRGWTDMATIYNRICSLPDDSIVIHGGAEGADRIAGEAAKSRGFHVAVMHAMWIRYGKSAGHKRNAAMLALGPDLVIAFSLGTNGTQGTIDGARRRGIPVEVIGTERTPALSTKDLPATERTDR